MIAPTDARPPLVWAIASSTMKISNSLICTGARSSICSRNQSATGMPV
jgi:hypothetical protein